MNTRVKQIRKILHLSQDAFAKRLGITAAGISKIESGSRSLTTQMLLMICREFHINERWLRDGDGEIFQQEQPDHIEQMVRYYQLDELDRKIILEYVKLDAAKRSIIKEYILKIAGADNAQGLIRDQASASEPLRVAEGTDTGY